MTLPNPHALTGEYADAPHPKPRIQRRPQRVMVGVTYYRCRRCGHWKPEEKFHRLGSRMTVCNRRPNCAVCDKVIAKPRVRQAALIEGEQV